MRSHEVSEDILLAKIISGKSPESAKTVSAREISVRDSKMDKMREDPCGLTS